MSKNWQRVTKRERERAVELKRTQKRERKQAAAAEKAALKDGTAVPESAFDEQPLAQADDDEADAGPPPAAL